MCGIVGYFGSPIGGLGEATAGLGHRGPDAQRVREGPGYGLGHSLLSIIGDVPVEQPITSRDGRYTVAFNGEIYNYIELREATPALAAVTGGRSDTEVLVEGIALRGLEVFNEANGMFAAAVVDHETTTGYLVRDRLGIKPLYYSRIGDSIVFASELRTVLELVGRDSDPDPEGYYSYARFRYPIGDRTFDRAVRMLPPGSILTWNDGRVRMQQYWEIRPQPRFEGSYDDALDALGAVLDDSIKLRMRSDHSFCTFLSGGLDSSYLTAVAATTVTPLQTYSISFADEEYDESKFALQVADLIGTDHHPHLLSGDEYAVAFSELAMHLRSPLGVPNQVALSVLSRELATDHRCVLSGEGADEVFGGYGRIFLLPSDWELLEQARATGSDPNEVEERLASKYGKSAVGDYPALFIARYGYIGAGDARRLLEPFFSPGAIDAAEEAVEGEIRQLFDGLDGVDPFSRQLLVFQKLHLPGLLLRLDSASMFHSVEARVPFLDHRLVEWANSLPIEYRMRRLPTFDAALDGGALSDDLSEVHDQPKALLKDIARPALPSGIVDRRKLGFPIPVSYYARGAVQNSGIDHPYLKWIEANLELSAQGGWL